MPLHPAVLLKISSATLVASLLCACGGTGRLPPSSEQQRCPPNEVVVCRGGTASKAGRIGDREPRLCECRSRDRVTF